MLYNKKNHIFVYVCGTNQLKKNYASSQILIVFIKTNFKLIRVDYKK